MLRTVAITGLAAVTLGAAAYAQDIPELAGGPGQRPPAVAPALIIPQKKTQTAAASKLKADQAKIAQQADAQKAEQARLAALADAQKAEQARLAKLADDLKAQQAKLDAQQAKLDAKASDMAAQEKRLVKLTADVQGQQATAALQLAQLRDAEKRAPVLAAATPAPAPVPPPLNTSDKPSSNSDASPRDYASRDDGLRNRPDDRSGDGDQPSDNQRSASPPTYQVDLDLLNTAQRSCTRAAQDAAYERNYYSASYDTQPRLYQDNGYQLRGQMRLESRRGYRVVDTVCTVAPNGQAQSFTFLR